MGNKETTENKESSSAISITPSLTERVAIAYKKFNSQLINRLLLRFMGLMALFYLLWATPLVQKTIIAPIAQAYAYISGAILNLMGYGVNVSRDVITSTDFSISIKNGCDGIEGLAIFLCAIAIYPATLRQKLKGLGYGVLFLVVLNLFRIITLYMTGIHFPNLFDVMHESIWQILFIALTLVALFTWIDSLPKTQVDQDSL